jgi:integrase
MKRLSAAARRFYWECECQIWITGHIPGTGDWVRRQATGATSLKEAEAMRDAWIRGRRKEARDQVANGPMLGECIEKYLAARAEDLHERTLAQTKSILGRLRDFCEARNAIYMKDLTVDILETFKTEGLAGMASTTKGTVLAKLRCFLRAAFRREWIDKPIVERISTQRAVYEQKEPFSDKEALAILGEAERLTGGTHGFAAHPKTFRLLLELMLETGMRVGDAIRFDPRALSKGKSMWVYTFIPQKQKRAERAKHAEAYLTARLKEAIDTAEWLTPGERPFSYGSSRHGHYLPNEVYARMQTIGERCGVKDCRPHRLRDTFAVRCLLRGLQLEDVSRLLGHSSVRVTEMYYARWVTARKRRLEGLLAESMVNA